MVEHGEATAFPGSVERTEHAASEQAAPAGGAFGVNSLETP